MRASRRRSVELNPDDAAELGVSDGDPVRITSRRASIEIAVRLSDRVARKQIFIPMHYREAAANLLTNPALDPYAAIPEFKVCAVHIEPVTRKSGWATREASARRRATASASSRPETTEWISGSTEKLRSSPVRPAGSDAHAHARWRRRACRSR